MTDLMKMKWPQCFYKKKARVDKKIQNDKVGINDSEDDLDTCEEKQLDDLLYKFADEIFYDEENKEKLLKMDITQKRILIRSSRQKFQSTFELLEVMLERLRRLSMEGEVEDQETEKLFDQLSAALRTESLSYVHHFMDSDGLGLIFVYMRDCAIHALNSQIFSQSIRCIRSLGNSENGYNYLLAFKSADERGDNDLGLIEVIGKGLWSKNGVTVSMICELFGALCFTEDGWHRVMKALLFLSRNDVHHRFDILVQQFLFQENLDTKCAVLSLINAIAEFVQDHRDPLVNRVHLRYQTVKSGLITFLNPYRDCSNNALRKQIEIFIKHQKEDINLLRNRGRLSVTTDFLIDSVESWDDLVDFISAIKLSLTCTDAQTHLISLLHHLLLLPLKNDNGFLYLQLLDTLVQQISIQPTYFEHPDPGLTELQLNIDEMLTKLATDNDLKAKQSEVDNLLMEQKTLESRILDLENQCFSLETDKIQLKEMCDLSAAQIESCSSQYEQITVINNDLQQEISQLKLKLDQLKLALSMKGDNALPAVLINPPINDNVLLPPPPPLAPCPPPPPPPAPCAPPPPPLITNIPRGLMPPPPPSQLSQLNPQTPCIQQKDIPKVIPLKCLNWTKVPQAKLTESIWGKVDENHIYSILDLDTLQAQFSTATVDSSLKSQSTPTMSHKSIIVSSNPSNVVSNQRSQNLYIKLKPARMTWSKWEKYLFDCKVNTDAGEDSFPYQLAEGLLTLYPTAEEIELLEDAVSNHGLDNLPEAETFMFECYKFPHYLDRLSSLIFMYKAPEHIKRINAELKTAKSAMSSVMKSPLLPKLLEIILAVGNVMNQKRGVAYGFKVESLNQLKKLKCSQTGSEGVSNLLQFVAIMAEKLNPAILDLPKRLECVQDMAKVNVGNITKDINEISCGLQKLSNTIDIIRRSSREPRAEDHFLEVAKDYHMSITKDFNQLNNFYKIIKLEIEKCHQFFGENPPSSSSESEDTTQKLFAEFSLFLTDLESSWRSILNDRERKVLLQQRRGSLKPNGQKPIIAGKKGEMDVNISKLLSGDAFKENRLFMARQSQLQSIEHGHS